MNQHQDFGAGAPLEEIVSASAPIAEVCESDRTPTGLGYGIVVQTTLLSRYSNPMDNAFPAGGIFANHDSFTRSGLGLERRELKSQSHKATPVLPRSISQVSGTGNLVFSSSMEAVTPRRLGPRSRADKDAAQHLKRAGGACLKHKASRKRVSQWL
jgi:hypothetical protein